MIKFAGPIERDSLRLRSEFLDLPGLSVTPAQAARLLGIRLEHARTLLADLERERFLTGMANGAYRRAEVRPD